MNMDRITKTIFLQECNGKDINTLESVVKSGNIKIEELEEAGLDNIKINELKVRIGVRVNSIIIESEKQKLLKKIKDDKIEVKDIISSINDTKTITYEDLIEIGLSEKNINSIKFYASKGREATIFKKIEDLPPMGPNRTDVYFVGLPRTGKSTMLAGLLYMAYRTGILLPDTYQVDGAVYQNQIISDLRRGVLPRATAEGSFNYIAMSLKDAQNKNHPLNVVEVPGELYKTIYYNNNVNELLTYLSNKNKKILIFTIDSMIHENMDDFEGALDQSLVYVNIINMFKNNRILEQTDAIYLIVNKFDTLKANRYKNDNRPDEDIALEFLETEFRSLITNCKDAREKCKNKFKIRILPYSIGSISFKYILNEYNDIYPKYLLGKILDDSFLMNQ